MIDPGKLNRRITLQSEETQRDGYGQPSSTWTDTVSTWASIRATTGKEVYAASGFTSQLSHVITIRYQSTLNVTDAMRVTYGTRTFTIQAVSDPDEGKVQLNLLCLEDDASA